MPKPFDATMKQILDDYAPDWAALLLPGLGLPVGPLVALDPQVSIVQVAADKVFRLPEAEGVLHLEVQSGWDGGLPDRMLEYNVYLHGTLGGPVYSAAVLLRRDANASAITGRLVRTRHDGRAFLTFEYEVIRVWELHADDLLTGGLGMLPLCLLTDDAQQRLPELVRRLADRAAAEIPDPQVRDRFIAGSSILMGLRYDEVLIASLFTGVQNMEESSVYRTLIRKGRESGHVEGLRSSLFVLLEQKFGQVPSDVQSRIWQSSDANRLRDAVRQVLTIASPAELVL